MLNDEQLYTKNDYRVKFSKHRIWGVKRFCEQFRKLVSSVDVKRNGSTPREYEIPSLNDCKLFFAEKYSLDSDVFEIN
jgi:hypothetical protein